MSHWVDGKTWHDGRKWTVPRRRRVCCVSSRLAWGKDVCFEAWKLGVGGGVRREGEKEGQGGVCVFVCESGRSLHQLHLSTLPPPPLHAFRDIPFRPDVAASENLHRRNKNKLEMGKNSRSVDFWDYIYLRIHMWYNAQQCRPWLCKNLPLKSVCSLRQNLDPLPLPPPPRPFCSGKADDFFPLSYGRRPAPSAFPIMICHRSKSQQIGLPSR